MSKKIEVRLFIKNESHPELYEFLQGVAKYSRAEWIRSLATQGIDARSFLRSGYLRSTEPGHTTKSHGLDYSPDHDSSPGEQTPDKPAMSTATSKAVKAESSKDHASRLSRVAGLKGKLLSDI